MKYFCISDVHGDYAAMLYALDIAEYNPNDTNHQIISCGDHFGRAAQTREDCINVYRYLTNTIHANKPICIRGNHETIELNIFRTEELDYIDVYNGEHNTIASFADCPTYEADWAININKAAIILEPWIKSLPWYYETKNHIFTHGFIPAPYDGKNLAAISDSEWDYYSWAKTPQLVYAMQNNQPNGIDKTLVVGHWHAAKFIERYTGQDGMFGIIYKNEDLNIVFLDCCTAMGCGMQVYVVEDEPND